MTETMRCRILSHIQHMEAKTKWCLRSWGYKLTACDQCREPHIIKLDESKCDRCNGRPREYMDRTKQQRQEAPDPRTLYVSADSGSVRDLQMVERWLRGENMADVGKDYGLSRERARQIITQHRRPITL